MACGKGNLPWSIDVLQGRKVQTALMLVAMGILNEPVMNDMHHGFRESVLRKPPPLEVPQGHSMSPMILCSAEAASLILDLSTHKVISNGETGRDVSSSC